MRLGDLDALKEDLKQYFSDGTLDSVSAKLAFNMILRKIDNATTVEITEEQAIDKLHETGWLQEHDKQMTERPQGKWILRTDTEWHFECNQCKGLSPWKAQFCGVCGADMRKGGKE